MKLYIEISTVDTFKGQGTTIKIVDRKPNYIEITEESEHYEWAMKKFKEREQK